MLIQYTQTASIVIWYYQSEWDTMGNGMRSYISICILRLPTSKSLLLTMNLLKLRCNQSYALTRFDNTILLSKLFVQ